jgi:hypothetical protein
MLGVFDARRDADGCRVGGMVDMADEHVSDAISCRCPRHIA